MRKSLEIELSRIQPSDTPRSDSYWHQLENIRRRNLHPPVDLVELGITLNQTEDGTVYPKNGNHRLGAIAELLGLNTIVIGELGVRSFSDSSWEVQLDRVRKLGIRNYRDWLEHVGEDEE